jgi:Skp family chaperone for outer membrane proteins
VKSLISTIALAVLAISSFATAANAQEGGIVAVLDVAQVFKVNQAFDLAMNNIKTKAEGLKAEIQQRQEVIKGEAQQIATSGYDLGSPQRNEMEGAVEQKQAALRTWARQQEALLLNEEAQVYFNTYKKMQTVVGTIAQSYNISLVIRYDGSEVSAASRPEVIKAVNRSVVYHKDIDLTNMVIKEMGPRVAEAPGATQTK